MKHFSERNPSWIAVGGTIGLILLFLGIMFSEQLPLVGAGKTYQAEFAESAGLAKGNEVRIAGVKVGKVTAVELDGTKVLISFTVNDQWMGDDTTASIELKTLLGQKYLSVDPQGDKKLDAGDVIPLEHTTVPFDVTEAFEGLSSRLNEIDVPQLEQSFEALTESFDGTPRNVRTLLDGLSGLARTIADRDDEFGELMRNTRAVTENVAGMDGQIESILTNGDLLMKELASRRTAIHDLLVGTRDIAEQVSGFVRDNAGRLSPALKKLDRVTAILKKNKANVSKSLTYLKTYYTTLTDATGTGPWLDGYICGLFDGTRPELDEGVVRNCQPGGAR